MPSNNFNLSYLEILRITEDFYDLAKADILIGYHFRNITDFQTHIPRIAHFWELQLTGQISKPSELPYHLMSVHKALKINPGELGRWVVLFTGVLNDYKKKYPKQLAAYQIWEEKILFFRDKFLSSPQLFFA